MSYLHKINEPRDLKKLTIAQLETLVEEIRFFLLGSLAETGGHLSSNLGVAELTVALHYCFSTPTDKLVWDVGHQSYVHKILTGRKHMFPTLRKYKGLCGFPKTQESPHDSFNVGHSSTSISAAFGMACARDLRGENHKVVAIIGDGAMTGGLAYEALNNAGRSKTDFLVILNDNQMSISENVGAVSRHLNEIRTAKTYHATKLWVRNRLQNLSAVGGNIAKLLETTKNRIRYFLLPGVLFEEMGFHYIGPINGNDLGELIHVLQNIRQMKGPILLHVLTQKGKGYEQAEHSPSAFHGVDSFDIATGKSLQAKQGISYSEVFGNALQNLASSNKKIVAITAAMPSGTGLCEFQKQFPTRFFDVGIAEAHGVTFAAGLAQSGLIPVFAVYSTFLQRGYDQIVHDVCCQNLHVVFAIDRAGIVGADGETHQGIFDLSFLSHIPNMTVLAPKDAQELNSMLAFAISFRGPVAIRYPRTLVPKCFEETFEPIALGKSEIILQPEKTLQTSENNIAIFAIGAMVETAFFVCQRLAQKGVYATLVNARFLKPLDEDMVLTLCQCKCLFTLEDNVETGGLGAAVLQTVAKHNITANIKIFALPNNFIEQGSREELFLQYGLDTDSLCTRILQHL